MENFSEKEKEILRFWEERKIFEKSLQKRKKGTPFVFYEGPPTANARPGIHHVLARSFKDIILRFKTMQGFYASRQAGWDTHGLPVELEVEKELGLNSKKDIETYGVEKFNKKAKENIWRYKKEWEDLTRRMGFWLDMDNPYITYETSYIESLWAIIKKFYEKGLLYEDFRVSPWCYRCGTVLSSHELAQGYKKVTDTAVYVKFELKDEPGTFILAWTTTPWTLPGNVALAIAENIPYSFISVAANTDQLAGRMKRQGNELSAEGGLSLNSERSELRGDTDQLAGRRFIKTERGEVYILATSRLTLVQEEYSIIKEMKGKELVGLSYEPLFDVPQLKSEKSYKVYAADFVKTDEGTGVVHTAVMYGEDDYKLGTEIGLPKFHTVSEEGKFVDSLGEGLGGMAVKAKDTEEKIVAYLDVKGLLLRKEEYEHEYPFCWRCKNPLLYYATRSWFIKVTAVKDALIKNNQKINWIPAHLKDGRFGNFLEEVKDWAFSRRRYWGTPLPIWRCERCGAIDVVGSLEELEKKAIAHNLPTNSEGEIDVHRPFIDNVLLRCYTCKGDMKRVEEIADVWFDSGAMPFASAQIRNSKFEIRNLGTLAFPADYICEAIDQTRGWFYTLLTVSTLLGFESPYKNVISLGHLLDEKGRKMSKSLGNTIDPFVAGETYSMDAIRWYFFVVNPPGFYKRFDPKEILSHQRAFLITLFNCANFLKLSGGSQEKNINEKPKGILERWILSRLNETVRDVTGTLEAYDITNAARKLEELVSDLSLWYIRRTRKRIEHDKEVRNVLYVVMVTMAKLIAPFVPFSAEIIAKEYLAKKESIHLSDWPRANTALIDNNLNNVILKAREVVTLLLAKRSAAGIKVRQVLASATMPQRFPQDVSELIMQEVNVKHMWVGELSIDTTLTKELLEEGFLRDLIRQTQDLRKKAGLKSADSITLFVHATSQELKNLIVNNQAMIQDSVGAKTITFKDLLEGTSLNFQGERVTIEIRKI